MKIGTSDPLPLFCGRELINVLRTGFILVRAAKKIGERVGRPDYLISGVVRRKGGLPATLDGN
jgi:hypothetical protein